MPLQLAWQNCTNGYCSLFNVDLAHNHFDSMEGVYIIWQANGPVIRVGQGTIRDRLAAHRQDAAIAAYQNLYSSWAPVAPTYRDRVERYLANVLRPLVGDAFPNALPLAVTLPWAWSG